MEKELERLYMKSYFNLKETLKELETIVLEEEESNRREEEKWQHMEH